MLALEKDKLKSLLFVVSVTTSNCLCLINLKKIIFYYNKA